MKGERIPAHAHWRGNPAEELTAEGGDPKRRPDGACGQTGPGPSGAGGGSADTSGEGAAGR